VTVMLMLWSLSFFWGMFFQAGVQAPATGPLDPVEKGRIEREGNIERRIKIYESASNRIQRELGVAMDKGDFQAVPDNLKLWVSLLSESLRDIGTNLKNKKKSRALINYEIRVRKAILSTQNYKIQAPIEQQDVFESSLEQAETIRKKFVEILFQH
jgi:hypothetical protein